MKLSPVIAQYLQQNKSLNIEGFGRFYIDDHALYNEDGDKPSKTGSAVRFEFTPNNPTDPEFIDFVVKETGKIRPLAIADMDSYTSLARQLLNISKPFVIEGVGTLVSTRGVLDFTPGNYEPPKITADSEKERRLRNAKENYAEGGTGEDYSYDSGQSRSGSGFNVKRMAALLLAAAVLAVAAWAVYKFVINKEPAKNTASSTTTGNDTGAKDTPGVPKDTSSAKPPVSTPATDGSIFRVVIKEITSKAEAAAFLKKYTSRGHNMVSVPNADSSLYKMKIGITRPVTDTARVRDSLRNYYFPKEKLYIEQ